MIRIKQLLNKSFKTVNKILVNAILDSGYSESTKRGKKRLPELSLLLQSQASIA